MPLLLTLLVGVFFLAGAVVAWRAHGREAVEVLSVAIAFGSLACVAALDLVPEVAEVAEELGWLVALLLVAAGVIVLVVLDRAVPDHHGEGAHGEEDEAAHIGVMTVIAISVHNLAEGAAIFTVASQDMSAGVALAVGVGLHNAPLGMLLFSAMERGRTHGIAVLAAAALSTFAGGLLMFLLGGVLDEAVMGGVVCVALGMIGYILLAELLPSMLRSRRPALSALGVVIGAAFVLAGMLLE
ncbi:MAG: hypothetical protein IJ087_15875 [Eggerthellaceae bacterium]|nr:hypothetical protein [Eggerthellaceae bacterium]